MTRVSTASGHRGHGPRRCAAAFLAAATLIGGCGSGSGDDEDPAIGTDSMLAHANDPACRLEPMREWVQASLLDYYLFADRVRPQRLADFDSDEAVLEALRVEPPDRYSYIADEATYDALFEQGRTFGFGWVLERTAPGTWVFSRVLPGSPFDRAGVVRGDRLVAIDGLAFRDFIELSPAEQRARLGLPATPTNVTFVVESTAGGTRELDVESASFDLVTVADVDIVEHRGARVGYLDFTSFLDTSTAELNAAFETLAGVDELVLDLRHNGGGRVAVAAAVAGAIGGRAVDGEVFARFRYNARYAGNDTAFPFTRSFRSLDLARVFVLTSEDTCSASELVINALEPFVDVVTIGNRTCGKPYGTAPERRCGRVLNALEVSFRNAADVGDYVDGLSADCVVDDDFRSRQGRPGDPLYDAAIGFLERGTCGGGRPFADAVRSQVPPPDDAPRFGRPPAGGAILP